MGYTVYDMCGFFWIDALRMIHVKIINIVPLWIMCLPFIYTHKPCRTYDHMIIYLCLYIIALFGNKKSAFGHADVGGDFFLTYDVYIRGTTSQWTRR